MENQKLAEATEEGAGVVGPGVFVGAVVGGGGEAGAERGVGDEFFQRGGEGGAVGGVGEEAGEAVAHGFGDAAGAVGDGGKAVGGGFEVGESEAFETGAVGNGGEDEEVGLREEGGEGGVGNFAEEADGGAGFFGEGFEAAAIGGVDHGDGDKVFDGEGKFFGEEGEGFEDGVLALARVDAGDREEDDGHARRAGRARGPGIHKSTTQRAGDDGDFRGGDAEMFFEQGADEEGDDDDAVGAVKKFLEKAAAVRAGGEAEDFRTVKREHEAACGQAAQGVKIHGGEERARLGEPDRGAGELGGEGANGAGEDQTVAPALRTAEGKLVDGERPGDFAEGGVGGGEDGDGAGGELGGGAGGFLDVNGDASAEGEELVRQNDEGRGGGAGHGLKTKVARPEAKANLWPT